MNSAEKHLSDQELVLSIDGELAALEAVRVESHLVACWSCRTRQQEMQTAINDFVRLRRRDFHAQIQPIDGPRALLKARMAEAVSSTITRRWSWLRSERWRFALGMAVLLCSLSGAVYLAFENRTIRRTDRELAIVTPDPSLTPGATVLISRSNLCSESNINNKAVPASVQRAIFQEYGLHTRKLGAYEVDYLITPALGGADDMRNLWPQSKSETIWNAEVKDALEEHLRNMVCDGQIDLAVAQHDMAADWIQAYKKYFHTDKPLPQYR